MKIPNFGDRVRVWPRKGLRVQDGHEGAGRADANGKHIAGRFLADEGREVVWDVYWHRRFLDGSIHLHNPAPVAAAAPASAQKG